MRAPSRELGECWEVLRGLRIRSLTGQAVVPLEIPEIMEKRKRDIKVIVSNNPMTQRVYLILIINEVLGHSLPSLWFSAFHCHCASAIMVHQFGPRVLLVN